MPRREELQDERATVTGLTVNMLTVRLDSLIAVWRSCPMKKILGMKSLFLFWLTILSNVSFSANTGIQKRDLSYQDFFLTKRLGAPIVSPNGQWAVVSVELPALRQADTEFDLWLISTSNSSGGRRITGTPGREADVAWHPDSSRVAFIQPSDDGVGQVFTLDVFTDDEAIQVTNLPTGASSPLWSPDGQKILYQSRVIPERGAHPDSDSSNRTPQAHLSAGHAATSYDRYPARYWAYWLDNRQPRLFVQEPRSGAMPVDILANTDLIDDPGFTGVLGLAEYRVQAQWSPDGEKVIFAASDNFESSPGESLQTHLYHVDLIGGNAERLTDDRTWNCTEPLFSPDGNDLYCRFQAVNDYSYNVFRVARIDWAEFKETGSFEYEILTSSFDRSVEQYVIGPDSQTVFIAARDHGYSGIFTVDSSSGDARPIASGIGGEFSKLGVAGKDLIAHWQSSSILPEIVRVDGKTGSVRHLSTWNKERTRSLAVRPYREFWARSERGHLLHSWLVLPRDFDSAKQYPLILDIHGGPYRSSTDSDHPLWSSQSLANQGYVVLKTDYLGSVGYGEEFSRGLQGDPMAGPASDLLTAMEEAIERFPFIDGDNLGAIGASYGGALVYWLLANDDRFSALFSHAGFMDLSMQWSTGDNMQFIERIVGSKPGEEAEVWRVQSAATYGNRFNTPTLVTAGELDFRVPIEQSLAAFSHLKRNGVPARLIVFHRSGHFVAAAEDVQYLWGEVYGWLKSYLKKDRMSENSGN